MTLSKQTLKRLPKIKSGLLLGLSHEKIGESCGVSKKTIDRDINAWVKSGEFEAWLREEWLRLHSRIISKDLVEAYRQVSKLLGKLLDKKPLMAEELHEIVLKWESDESHINHSIQAASRTKTVSQK